MCALDCRAPGVAAGAGGGGGHRLCLRAAPSGESLSDVWALHVRLYTPKCFSLALMFACVSQTALAAIIMVNLIGMFKQFRDIPSLWRTSKIELVSL